MWDFLVNTPGVSGASAAVQGGPYQGPTGTTTRDTTQLLRQGILVTAQSLGMDPADLATIISYETGGTFDPMQAGPTTQWGQHRGFIQFGEPQAQEYGADFSSPETALLSQLGPDGAVANYFRSNGWQPGMGMLDAYSIVNAGGPGRYNASDANNGGAPGTVADKVNGQMAGHQRNASELLGFGPGAAPAETGSYGADPAIAGAFAGYGQGQGAPAAQGNALASLTPFGPSAPVSGPEQIPGAPQGNALAALGQSQQAAMPGQGGYAMGGQGMGAPEVPMAQMPAMRPRVDNSIAQILAAFMPRPATY